MTATFINHSIAIETKQYLNIAGVIIVVLGADYCVKQINKKGCELLGYSLEEIEGRNWFTRFLPEEDQQKAVTLFQKITKGVVPPLEEEESVILTKSGATRLIHWDNSYIQDEGGAIIAVLRSGEDITEKRVLQLRLAAQEAEKRKQLIGAVLEAQEKERFHIAAELHDNIAQLLTTCKLLLESERSTPTASASTHKTYQYLQKAINEVRGLSHELNPAQLEEIGLQGSLEELVGQLRNATTLKISLYSKGAKWLSRVKGALALSIFRIVQEQLQNIIKHAAATAVQISIEVAESSVEFEIRDNGKGFDLKKTPKGLGLKNIYYRAEVHNGKAAIDTAPGEGCVLSIYLPL